jgi:hypothetical protein
LLPQSGLNNALKFVLYLSIRGDNQKVASDPGLIRGADLWNLMAIHIIGLATNSHWSSVSRRNLMLRPLFDPHNGLLTEARSGKLLPPVWVVIPVAFVIVIVAQFGALPITLFFLLRRLPDLSVLAAGDMEALLPLMLPQTTFEQMLLLVSAFVGIYFLLALWVWAVEGRSWRTMGLQGQGQLFKFGRGFGFGALMFVVVVIVGMLFGLYQVEVNPALSLRIIGGVLVVLIGWLAQGPAEELLFRGWVLPVVSARHAVWLGIIVSSVMFAVVHIGNFGISILAVVNLLLFGLFTAAYALYEESVWGVFGIHAVWNWAQGNIFGLAVSGNPATADSLFVTQATGAEILTGGSFGPEGGLLVSFVLGAVIGILFWRNRSR